ncbi:hypothetical protein [Streptomyces sp. SM12]|uniref:hypothetical protein n=1 Tax=Streptomyces sp. SM12 TaxID=1071602 RepID=UPI000CD5361C|nr:hypothetical protein [Streptomyces sp. SM12]
MRITTGHVTATAVLHAGVRATAAAAVARTLPGGWAAEDVPVAGRPHLQVAVGPPAVSTAGGVVRVRLPATAAATATLAYVTYTALERARQQQQMLTLHGTALHAPGGEAVLLLGTKGAGKTTTALALAARGWLHAGDDLVVLAQQATSGGLEILPGKPVAAIRDRLRPLDPKPLLDLAPFATAAAPLTRIVRLAVHPHAPPALRPATPLSGTERLRLHEGLARYISGLPTPLTGVADTPHSPVWPLDTAALARWRTDLLTRLEQHRFDYLTAPDAESAADLLTKETTP